MRQPLCDRHLVAVYRDMSALLRGNSDGTLEPNGRRGTARPMHAERTAGEVYFLRFGDRIKIGFTTNLRARLTAIPHDEILATMPGTMQTEKALHHQFTDDRVHHEWFRMSDPLMAYIEEVRADA